MRRTNGPKLKCRDAEQSRTPDVAAQMIGSVPMRRYATLDEVAAAALFLLSDEASYITAFNLEVSGGAA